MYYSKYFLICFISCVSCTNCNKCTQTVAIHNEFDLSAKTEDENVKHLFIEGEWLKNKWWEIFDDEQLSLLVEIALKDNPSILSAKAKVEQANQDSEFVRSKFFPIVSGSFVTLQSHLNENGHGLILPQLNPYFQYYGLSLKFDYEFDFWGKNRKIFEAAVSIAKMQKALEFQAKLILSTAVVNKYFDLQSSMAKMELMQSILNNRSEQLSLIYLRNTNRIDGALQVNQIKSEIVALQQLLSIIKNHMEIDMSMLCALIGSNPSEDMPMLLVNKFDLVKIPMPKDLGLELLVRRPDLIAQIWRVQNASKEVGVAIANFYPNVNLMALGGLASLDLNKLFTIKGLTGSLLPSISLPIFTGGKLNANLKSKVAAYESAVYDYNSLLITASNEVVQCISVLKSLNEQVTFQKENVDFKCKTYNLVYSRYKYGIDSMTSLLISDENFIVSKLKKIDLENERTKSIVNLIKSMGGSYCE